MLPCLPCKPAPTAVTVFPPELACSSCRPVADGHLHRLHPIRLLSGSRLIQQAAVASTNEPDTAYFYDAGLRMAVPRGSGPGNNMESEISYYDTEGTLRVDRPNVSEK